MHTHTHTHTHSWHLRHTGHLLLHILPVQFSSVQFSCSVMSDSLRPHESQHTNSRSSLTLASIESVMLSSHLIFCCPILLPPIPPSIRVFSNESTLHMRWPKYWCFSFSIIPSKEIPGLIFFSMDWLDLLAVQGSVRNLKAEELICWFFPVFSLSLIKVHPL